MNWHCLTLLLAALLCSPACHAEVVDGQLVVRGVVTLPDGSPAAMATVAAASSSTEGRRVTTADPQGRYELRGVFGHGMHIHAASADQRHQAVLAIPSVDARLAAESPVSLQLSPAVEQRVQVVGEGGPASDVIVLVAGFGFQVQGTTNAAGAVTLRVPAQHAVDKIVAWNPNLGVGGARTVDGADISRDARIYLHPSSEHMVQVVDDQGDPVVGLELAVSFNTEATSWAVTGDLAEANVRTDAQGRARIPWAPRDGLKYVDSSPVGVDWMLFETAPPTLADATTVLRVRRRKLGSPAVGRVHLPGDLSPEGLLVIGTSSGPGNHFDSIEARVEADGSFAFHVPIDMGTGMAIADREWASDFWTGVVVPWQDADPEQVALEGYPAVPAVVKVTRGKSRRPVAQAWVHYTREVRFPYVEEGQLTTPFALVRAWFRTDRDGGAQIPFGIGSNELQVSSDDWNSEKEVSVAAGHQQEPIEVKFHRP